MIPIIEILSAILLFIFSQGILKAETADRHPILIQIVAGLANIGALASFYDGMRSTVSIVRSALQPAALASKEQRAALETYLEAVQNVPSEEKIYSESFIVPEFITAFEIPPNGKLAAIQTYTDDFTELSIWNLMDGSLVNRLSQTI